MGERTITIIPPKYADLPTPENRYRVAAYCRVSNPTEEQAGSLASQLQYYTTKIDENPLWENAGVYGEVGSGIYMKERNEFKKLMAKCRTHKVDLILVKSISRFARNSLDAIRSLRELQALGVDVYFEQEESHLLDPDSRMEIEIFCALAQNESENKSHDIKWGIDKGFKDGTSGYLNFKCYGYRSDKEQGLVIEPNKAEIVRMIFNLRLQSHSLGGISSELAKKKVPSPSGKLIWSRECIRKMLINEKYTGSALLQKTFIEDFFTGKQVKNIGQHDIYLIKNSHEAIVPIEVFEGVQEV